MPSESESPLHELLPTCVAELILEVGGEQLLEVLLCERSDDFVLKHSIKLEVSRPAHGPHVESRGVELQRDAKLVYLEHRWAQRHHLPAGAVELVLKVGGEQLSNVLPGERSDDFLLVLSLK